MKKVLNAARAEKIIEDAVLRALDTLVYDGEDWYYPILRIADEAGVPCEYARCALRSLVDQGHAKFANGLFTDDGMLAGSGYSISGKGRQRAVTIAMSANEGETSGLALELRRASDRLDLLDDDVIDTLDENQLGELSVLCQRAAEALTAEKDEHNDLGQ